MNWEKGKWNVHKWGLNHILRGYFGLLFEDKQSFKLGRVDKCQKVAKSHICFKHLLTCFVRYSLGLSHFIVHICLSHFFQLSFPKSQHLCRNLKKNCKLTRQGELRASAGRVEAESIKLDIWYTRQSEQQLARASEGGSKLTYDVAVTLWWRKVNSPWRAGARSASSNFQK